MEHDIPSISSGSVGSRFVSQDDLDKAKATRDEQWKAAYARSVKSDGKTFRKILGQEPPPRPQEDADYDGRSLYEKLQSQKTAKQEEWEEKNKFSNQFRSLEEDEVLFLDAVMEEKRAEERTRRDQDGEQVASFKQAVAARNQTLADPSAYISSSSSTPPSSGTSTKKEQPIRAKPGVGKKDQKTLLKGVVRKKANGSGTAATKVKPSSASSDTTKPKPTASPISDSPSATRKRRADDDDDDKLKGRTREPATEPGPKRPRTNTEEAP